MSYDGLIHTGYCRYCNAECEHELTSICNQCWRDSTPRAEGSAASETTSVSEVHKAGNA